MFFRDLPKLGFPVLALSRVFRRKRCGARLEAKLLGVPPFALNRLTRQVGRRSYASLRGCVEACVQADYDIKRGALREEAALTVRL